ncbi:MAG: hypothetical protein Q9Q40_04995 [Acidobacteriota bacterium]|nr:hypothetical protein [Acidobacteriota bacterium]MDQ7087448.1 hypothetical protein [Acidobacteriota bacterium]
MRTATRAALLGLLALPLVVVAGPSAPDATDPEIQAGRPTDGQILDLRRQLDEAETREAWEMVARRLLAALDRRGLGREPEALWLVNHLLETVPDDPVLLWRRADAARRAEDPGGAIDDLEHLVQVAPRHPLGVRARRALPALYLAMGRNADAAKADEALLAEGLADPIAVLGRLARTYALMGDTARVRACLERLEKRAPDRVRLDPEIMWLYAEAVSRLGEPKRTAQVMLHFANLFPRDPRRSRALSEAARAFRDLGRGELALQFIGEALEQTQDPLEAVQVRLTRGEVLASLGRKHQARGEFETVISSALDPEPAARALRLLLDMEEQERGVRAAVLMAVGLVRNGDPFIREMARNHFDRLVRKLGPELDGEPTEAAFFLELARKVDRTAALSAEATFAAAALREAVGDYEEAGKIYKLRVRSFGKHGQVARRGVARNLPREEVKGIPLDDPLRLRALEREQAWEVIGEILQGQALDGSERVYRRTLAARAAWAQGRQAQAARVLEPLSPIRGEAALMRGDARALAGRWKEACVDFRAAARGLKLPSARHWLQVRLAACEMREGRREAARKRIEKLLEREKPPMPALFAAEQLLARISGQPLRAEGEPSS